jgi:hypothetical protein
MSWRQAVVCSRAGKQRARGRREPWVRSREDLHQPDPPMTPLRTPGLYSCSYRSRRLIPIRNRCCRSVISLVSLALALLCCHSSQVSSTNLSPRFEPTHHAPASLIPNGITSHAALSWIQHRLLYRVLSHISGVVLSTSWGHAGFS